MGNEFRDEATLRPHIENSGGPRVRPNRGKTLHASFEH
jgi:hypothetical protein